MADKELSKAQAAIEIGFAVVFIGLLVWLMTRGIEVKK